ncbi:MAG: hypothetical protein IIA89_14880 [Chloroflexi bacterium]|nr:hypothetical protein [Chloroflexota bacterium]
MEILAQIQKDILNQEVPISAILRKAKVLAAQLESSELQEWASGELDGYQNLDSLPDYRLLSTSASGQWTNGYWTLNDRSVPMYKIDDEDLKKWLTTYPVYSGIRTVENLVADLGEKRIMFPPEIVALVNNEVGEQGYGYSTLHYNLDSTVFDQILDIVRNRLLDFILQLDKQWVNEEDPPPKAEVSELVKVTIYNRPEGGSVTVFDQRGQQVQYQFNAAGDIDLSAVKTIEQLSHQLDSLRTEIQAAKEADVIPEEVALEAEYHVLQAGKEANADDPDKSIILDHIGRAKEILGDLVAAAGLVKAIAEAAEVVSRII